MKKFIDESEVYIRSGHGGAGSTSFRREKYVPLGGPDGGDGGKGGDVVFVADLHVKTLYDVRRKQTFHAGNGTPGMSRKRSGPSAEDLVLALPVGTLVRDLDSGELVVDLDTPGKRWIAAKGGKGGLGNQHFATSVNQAPQYAQPGLPGEERAFKLELKIIADVGLVGFPNAGKSTLLAALTRANPRIAPYPFTTLNPNLGVLRFDDSQALVIADIPGIIEGASEGKGLGIEFLKHIERTRLLLIVVDGFTDEPAAAEATLRHELSSFSAGLAAKPSLRVLNKTDLPEARERAAGLTGWLAVSGATHDGIPALAAAIRAECARLDREAPVQKEDLG